MRYLIVGSKEKMVIQEVERVPRNKEELKYREDVEVFMDECGRRYRISPRGHKLGINDRSYSSREDAERIVSLITQELREKKELDIKWTKKKEELLGIPEREYKYIAVTKGINPHVIEVYDLYIRKDWKNNTDWNRLSAKNSTTGLNVERFYTKQQYEECVFDSREDAEKVVEEAIKEKERIRAVKLKEKQLKEEQRKLKAEFSKNSEPIVKEYERKMKALRKSMGMDKV